MSKSKKDVTCCGSTVTETTTKVTKTGGALCEMPTGAVQYIGARYVPVFADPIEWSADRPYEHLMMVQNQGKTYISRQAVPVGAPLPDDGEQSNEYWVFLTNWNAQIEQYRQEVEQYQETVEQYDARIAANTNGIQQEATARASGDTAMYKRTLARTVNVNDFQTYVTLPSASGRLQSMAYDPDSDTLYACYYVSGSNSYVRRFRYFERNAPGSTLSDYTDLEITNNHCNSATIAAGFLYVSSWNDNYVTVINLTTFTVVQNLELRLGALRTAAFGEYAMWVQPYNENHAYVLFLSLEDRHNMNRAMGFKKTLASQIEYVQDCTLNGNAFIRLCSIGDSATSRGYIEINSCWDDNAPIIVPITFTDAECEGITCGAEYDYIAYQNTIVRSKQLHSVRPQVGRNYNLGQDLINELSIGQQIEYVNNLSSGYNNSGLAYDTDTYTYDSGSTVQQFKLHIPQMIWQGMAGVRNIVKPSLMIKVNRFGAVPGGDRSRYGGIVEIPLSGIGTEVRFFNFMGAFGSAGGFYLAQFVIKINPGNTNDPKSDCLITIETRQYQEFEMSDDGTVRRTRRQDAENMVVNGLQLRIR